MKNVDPPPILATLFSKQQTPPHIRVKFKETPPNWLSFIYTPPKIGENGLHPPQKKTSLTTCQTISDGTPPPNISYRQI